MRPARLAGLLLLALAPGTARGQGTPTDLAGDPLPPGAVARLGTTRLRLHDWGGRAFLLPAGDRVLWLGQDGKVTYWDVATGKATDTFKDPDLFPTSNPALSPDGDRLALFGGLMTDKGYTLTLRLYDLKAKKTAWSTRPADADRQSGSQVEFTPDGRRLITFGGEGDVRVWDVKTGTELLRQRFRRGHHFALSPDGKTIATGEEELFLWDWEAGGEPRRIGPRIRTSYGSLHFAADGKTVYAHPDHGGLSTKAFDVATGRPTEPPDLGGRVAWFSFSPDGKTVAVGYRGPPGSGEPEPTIALRDVATGKELRRLSAAPSRLTGAQWSRDGSRVASYAEHRMLVWDAKSGRRLSPDLPGHDGGIQAITFASDGRVFTSGHDPTVRVWDPDTGKELLHMANNTYWVPGLAVSPDGALVAANPLGNEVRVWDSRTGKLLFRLLGHGRTGMMRKVRFSADEQTLVAYGDDFNLRAWDTLTGKLKSEHRLLPKELAGLEDDDQRMRMEYGIENRALDLGPDGNTLVRASGKDVSVYAVDTGKERFKIQADPLHVEKLALSADGKRLATAGLGEEPGKGLPVQKPDEGPKDYQVTVWNMEDASVVTRFRVPTKTWWSVLAFTADGRSVVAGSWDPVLRFYDAKTGDAVGTLDLPYRAECVAFSPDGKRVAVGFLDTTALVYDLDKALKPAKKE
jgi:WD40 repeat protein